MYVRVPLQLLLFSLGNESSKKNNANEPDDAPSCCILLECSFPSFFLFAKFKFIT